jgi:Phosphodiester glycosidase
VCVRDVAPAVAGARTRRAGERSSESRAAGGSSARDGAPTDGIGYELARIRLSDMRETTIYLVRHPLASTSVRVQCFPEPRRLTAPPFASPGARTFPTTRPVTWCRPGRCSCPAGARWSTTRIARASPPAPRNSISDITIGRHPRCALGVSDTALLAVCCDGRRSGVDGGLTLGELARLLISFGAEEAINLDGGGSATLVHRGHLLNRPYSNQDQPAPESRPVVTALLFEH